MEAYTSDHIRIDIPAVVQDTTTVMFHSVFPIEKGMLGREVITSAGRGGDTVSVHRLQNPLSEERVLLCGWQAVVVQKLQASGIPQHVDDEMSHCVLRGQHGLL